MDKSVKILLYAVLGIVVLQGLYTLLFSHSLLKDAVNDIKGVKADLRGISDSLSSSQRQIGSIQQNLDRSHMKMDLMKSQVEILYLDYHNDETKSRVKRDSLKTELKIQEQYIDSLKTELDALDK
jgi:hypothetical protein